MGAITQTTEMSAAQRIPQRIPPSQRTPGRGWPCRRGLPGVG